MITRAHTTRGASVNLKEIVFLTDFMSFEYAPVSKGELTFKRIHFPNSVHARIFNFFSVGLMVGCALTSILVGLFDVKHYFHLQVSPAVALIFILSWIDYVFSFLRTYPDITK